MLHVSVKACKLALAVIMQGGMINTQSGSAQASYYLGIIVTTKSYFFDHWLSTRKRQELTSRLTTIMISYILAYVNYKNTCIR